MNNPTKFRNDGAMLVRSHWVWPFRREILIIGSTSGKVPKGTGGRTYERLEIIITCKMGL